jgi:hypothetical protein
METCTSGSEGGRAQQCARPARPLRAFSRGRAQAFYGRGGSCWSAHVLPSGSLKVTNEPHG